MHTKRSTARRRAEAGFTLIELMVVIVIIGMLAAIVVPRFMGAASKAAQTTARAQINSFRTALQFYKLENVRYPSTAEGLEALIKNAAGKNYLQDSETIPKDPWGNDYQLAAPGTHNPNGVDIWSNGPDGVPGTADDVGNWD